MAYEGETMDAYKEALKKKLEGGKGKKMGLEVELEMEGKPVPDLEHADHKLEGDAITEDKEKEEGGLAPDLENYQGPAGEAELAEEGEFNQIADEEGKEGQPDKVTMEKILMAIGDRGHKGRGPLGLAERAAMSAKDKLAEMKKVKKA